MSAYPEKSAMAICLASASPRRQELLGQIGLRFMLLPQDIDESRLPREAAPDYVRRMAGEKALAGIQDVGRPAGLPVLAADTTVVCNEAVLEKPQSQDDAVRMLQLLSGRSHEVLTAVALASENSPRVQLAISRTLVSFRNISLAEAKAYWETGEPADKAGAYGIQGMGAMFVSHIEGSYTNVVGLPLFETLQLLASLGITGLSLLEGAAK